MELGLKGKTALITGGAGFIGSHVLEGLSNRPEIEVAVLDNRGDFENISDLSKRRDIEIFRADIRDYESVKDALKGFDSVVHLAAHQAPCSTRSSLIGLSWLTGILNSGNCTFVPSFSVAFTHRQTMRQHGEEPMDY